MYAFEDNQLPILYKTRMNAESVANVLFMATGEEYVVNFDSHRNGYVVQSKAFVRKTQEENEETWAYLEKIFHGKDHKSEQEKAIQRNKKLSTIGYFETFEEAMWVERLLEDRTLKEWDITRCTDKTWCLRRSVGTTEE